MKLGIQITEFTVDVKPVDRKDNIRAFVTWQFETDKGMLKIYGGTIRAKEFNWSKEQVLTYDPPAVRMKNNFLKVFFIDNADFYRQLCDFTIEDYCTKTGSSKKLDISQSNEKDDESESSHQEENDDFPF